MMIGSGWEALKVQATSHPWIATLVYMGSQLPTFVAFRSAQPFSKSVGMTALTNVVGVSIWTVLILATSRLNAYHPTGALLCGIIGILGAASVGLMVAADLKAFKLLSDPRRSRQAFGDHGRLVLRLTAMSTLLQVAVLVVGCADMVYLIKNSA